MKEIEILEILSNKNVNKRIFLSNLNEIINTLDIPKFF